ncbi:glycosyl hydrolase 2 galactose-binding domain-containing protein [Arcticibacter sp.]|uniref:glycoside hydrolase family 2 protein n=1 Tax=Arcticibacter sp. TaxID=1872630 RepID=UPI003890CC4C
MQRIIFLLTLTFIYHSLFAQAPSISQASSRESVFLRSKAGFRGSTDWVAKKASEVLEGGKDVSDVSYRNNDWQEAVIPGTALTTLVHNQVYPDPYFGDNNRISKKLIPDISEVGKEFYTYWYRTLFRVPGNLKNKRKWLKFHGINYRSEIWLNGKKLGEMAGMFNTRSFDVTEIINMKGENALAVRVVPVDVPGSSRKDRNQRVGAVGENKNGGDGEIGRNVSMLMSVGWDFTAPDGIRDRNTGIWRDVELYATGDAVLEDVFVQTKLPLPDTSFSDQTISVTVVNATAAHQNGLLKGRIADTDISFQKPVQLGPSEKKIVVLRTSEFPELKMMNPKLWWPLNKGAQHLYTLDLEFETADSQISHQVSTRFGIREITSDQKTPDESRRFLVNGHPVFIRGTNWVPEAMLRNDEERTYAELRYTKQAGINLIRLWGGGIAESDYFYDLCDEMGILVWTEFWITGDTRFPSDTALYFRNLESTVKRIRNHPAQAYYVSANESTELKGAGKLIHQLDSTRGYQVQSECCGIHDGSPYKYENPMQYFENTASPRGSRVDGFNPEYGTPCLPVYESLRKMMPASQLWPIDKQVWDYMDGGGFHQITTKYKQAVDEFGESRSIEEFSRKAQFVGAMNYRAIWEVWNYNKFDYGDRFASGLLFWYHNSPVPQVSARLYDWTLEPTAGLYYSQDGLEPLHAQFDYLKNTVSVYNDFRQSFAGYTIVATLYDINSGKISAISKNIDIPADGVVNDALKLDIPSTISQVHFIYLSLNDNHGNKVSDSFYWRSKDKYKGAWSMTGPAVSGFQELKQLPETSLVVRSPRKKSGRTLVSVQNTGSSISFFTRLKMMDKKGNSIKPILFSDNFFSLLPGESRDVEVKNLGRYKGRALLVVDAWNTKGETVKRIKRNTISPRLK